MYQNQRYPRETVRKYGLVHAIFGTGPGKTSRAIGLAIRMAGTGGRVVFVQFMKSGDSSEVKLLSRIPNIEYLCPGKMPFILPKGPKKEHYEHAEQALAWAVENSRNGIDLLICDEILDALYFRLISLDNLLDLIRGKNNRTELVMTGADLPQEIFAEADYVTQLIQIKHPYYKGVHAREGIEY